MVIILPAILPVAMAVLLWVEFRAHFFWLLLVILVRVIRLAMKWDIVWGCFILLKRYLVLKRSMDLIQPLRGIKFLTPMQIHLHIMETPAFRQIRAIVPILEIVLILPARQTFHRLIQILW